MKFSEFFELLPLQIGEVEKTALKERNPSAHGHNYLSEDDDFSKLSKNIKVLYTLFNRLVLKITDASEYYIDYSTVNYPIRHIDHPMG